MIICKMSSLIVFVKNTLKHFTEIVDTLPRKSLDQPLNIFVYLQFFIEKTFVMALVL
jgi:hypothetical protein